MNAKDFKYHLDISSEKYVCPRCGKKRFVIYLDADGREVHPTVGRCDRQDQCRYHLSPGEYFRQTRPYSYSVRDRSRDVSSGGWGSICSGRSG